MPSMDYFRRPQLAGKNLQRQTYATVRGYVRRSDADGSSAVPYFPNVVVGQTVNVETQDGSVSVVLSAKSLYQVIADLNTSLATLGAGSAAKAYDADGCVAISSKKPGANGYIKITGGTAVEGLGLASEKNGISLFSNGGELFSTAEGRRSNAWGTAFPAKDENLTSESLQRVAGRLAANLDVLYSEHKREDVLVRQVLDGAGNPVIFTSSTDINANLAYITPPATTRLYNGHRVSPGDVLDRNSSKESLVPYFLFIDTVTKRPAQSRVVGMTRGVPTGLAVLPLADTASWVANDGGNVLGMDLAKVSAVAITAIHAGKVIKAATATFITSGVVVGDLVELTGVTNINPFSHGGYRWVVEKVLEETMLEVRPLSKAELTLLNQSLSDTQPILELNENLEAAQSYGNISVKTGAFTHGVKLIVHPPLPANASYELWAAQPTEHRSLQNFESQASLLPVLTKLASNIDEQPNGFIQAPWAQMSGADVQVTDGYVMWHGKPYYIPAQTFLNTSFTDGVDSYLYWDSKTALVKKTETLADILNWDKNDPDNTSVTPAASGHIIAEVSRSAGVIEYIKNCQRQIAADVRTITVGHGGQFADLERCFNHLNKWTGASAESASPSGSYPHIDIVLVSDVQINAGVTIESPSVRIRGGVPGVKIKINTSAPFIHVGTKALIIEDVDIESLVVSSLINVFNSVGADYVFRNITQTGRMNRVLSSSFGSTKAKSLLIDGCSFTALETGVVGVAGTAGVGSGVDKIVFRNSVFTWSNLGAVAVPQIISSTTVGSCFGSNVYISGCRFLGWDTSGTSAQSLLIADISAAGAGHIVVKDSIFDVQSTGVAETSLVSSSNSHVQFHGNVVGSATRGISAPLSCPSDFSVVSNCTIYCRSTASAVPAVKVARATNNKIVGMGAGSGYLLAITKLAHGNVLSGTAVAGIRLDAASLDAIISDNDVSVTGTAVSIAASNSSKIQILGCKLTGTVAAIDSMAGIPLSKVLVSNCFLYGPVLSFSGTMNDCYADANITLLGNSRIRGCTFGGTVALDTTAGNIELGDSYVTGAFSTTSSSGTYIASITGCWIIGLATLTGGYHKVIRDCQFESTGSMTISGAGVFSDNVCRSSLVVSNTDATLGFLFEGNQFLNATGMTFAVTAPAVTFKGNRVAGAGTFTYAGADFVTRIQGNHFEGNVSVISGSLIGNDIVGNLTHNTVSTAPLALIATGNSISGNVTFKHGNFSENHVGGNITVQNDTGDATLFAGNYSESTNGNHVIEHARISNCHFKNSLGYVDLDSCEVSASRFDGQVSLTAASNQTKMTTCHIGTLTVADTVFEVKVSHSRIGSVSCLSPRATFEGNYVDGAAEFTYAVVVTHSVHINSNYFSSTVKIGNQDTLAIMYLNVEFTGNEVVGAFTALGSATDSRTWSVSHNNFKSSVSMTGIPSMDFSGNYCATTATFLNGGYLRMSENHLIGAFSLSSTAAGQDGLISQNSFFSTGSFSGARLTLTSNIVSGICTITISAANGEANLTGNQFLATTTVSAQSHAGCTLTGTGNYMPTGGATMKVGTTSTRVPTTFQCSLSNNTFPILEYFGTVAGGTQNVAINGNLLGTTVIDGAEDVSFVGNTVSGAFSLDACSRASVGSNSFNSSVTVFTATTLRLNGNTINGSFSVNAFGENQYVGNYFGSSCVARGGNFSNNTVVGITDWYNSGALSGNVFHGDVSLGVSSADPVNGNVVFSNNYLDACGLRIYDNLAGNQFTVSGNVIDAPAELNGVITSLVGNIALVGNSIAAASYAIQIGVSGDVGLPKRIVINGNVLKNVTATSTSAPLRIFSGAFVHITNNVIRRDAGVAGSQFIRLEAAAQSVIIGHNFFDGVANGIVSDVSTKTPGTFVQTFYPYAMSEVEEDIKDDVTVSSTPSTVSLKETPVAPKKWGGIIEH